MQKLYGQVLYQNQGQIKKKPQYLSSDWELQMKSTESKPCVKDTWMTS